VKKSVPRHQGIISGGIIRSRSRQTLDIPNGIQTRASSATTVIVPAVLTPFAVWALAPVGRENRG